MPINVSQGINSDTGQIIVVERIAAGSYVDGLYVDGATSTFKTFASVQQPTPKELQKLKEGERDKDVRKFISKKILRTTQDRDNLPAHVVQYKGNRYKIVMAGDWDVYGHTTAFGVRVQ